MINQQAFTPYSPSNVISRDVNYPRIFSKIRVIWSNLLGRNTEDINELLLFDSPKLSSHIQKTKKDFKKNSKNLKKYPILDKIDWE